MITYNNFDLSKYNSYRIKSTCSKVFFPETVNDIKDLFNSDINNKIIIGAGNNIILSKQYYKEEFVIISKSFSSITKKNNSLSIQSGTSLKQISEFSLNNSLTGFEVFFDIPGTIGGATLMNAGTGDISIGNLITKVEFFSFDEKNIISFTKGELKWDYRKSIFQNMKGIILSVDVELKQGNKGEIKNRMNNIYNRRQEKQPRNHPNAGSVFKRPKGYYVGTLIEDLSLKGYTIGGAKVSEKHAGFIVNYNNATGKDIIKLINRIKTKVFKEKSVILELEQIII